MLKIFNAFAAILTRSIYTIIVFWDTTLEEELKTIESSILFGEIKNRTLLQAVILVEDRRFFEHKGIDVRAIMRASYKTVFLGRLEGGSTIEQQYVRLITNHTEITLRRKVREWILATKLSNVCSKTQILNSYLLKYQFIGPVYGVSEFAKKNDFDLEKLSNHQISILVARIKYPFAQRNSLVFLRRVMIVRQLLEQQEV